MSSVAVEDFPRQHRITVDEYHRMAEVGLLAPDARVELIEGVIVDMPPIGNGHAAAVDRLGELLHAAVGKRAIVRCQGPIRLGDLSEPQPDFALLGTREDYYETKPACAADTLLAIEVSESTLRYDLHTKKSLYARHAVPEVWILDVQRRQLHVFRNPSGAGYAEVFWPHEVGILPITSVPGVVLDLSPLLH